MRRETFVCAAVILGAGALASALGEPKRMELEEKTLEERAPAGFLGVSLAEVEPDEREDYGLAKDQHAMVVLEVTKGGPAEKAGLKAGDLLLGMDGKTFETREALTAAIRATAPGTAVKLRIQREGKEISIEPKVGAASAAGPGPGGARPSPEEMKRMQAQMLAQMPPEVREKFEAMQKKAADLQKKYKEEGLAPEEIQRKLQEALKPDLEEIRKSLQGGE